MDKAHRVQLSNEMLKAAGIDSNKVKMTMEDGKLIIVGENSNHQLFLQKSIKLRRAVGIVFVFA